jgi:LysM repeat protein
MKRILFFLMTALVVAPVIAPAQDAAMEERLNQLSAQIDVLKEAKELQNKKIETLEKQVSELQSKLSQPSGDYASVDDVKQLAKSLKEVDEKRQSDRKDVADQLEKIRKAVIGPGPGNGGRRPAAASTDTPAAKPGFDASAPHMEHKVEPGETLSAIASAYRAKGVKVSVQQILDANHIADPKNVKIGQVLIIPAGQ